MAKNQTPRRESEGIVVKTVTISKAVLGRSTFEEMRDAPKFSSLKKAHSGHGRGGASGYSR